MKRLAPSSDRSNIFDLVDGRTLDSGQLVYPYEERNTMRALQMHTSLLKRLQLDQQLEGHLGCVNTLAWNSSGSLLVSGSDDTRVNIWDYNSRKLVHSVDTGHTANIFCTKFLPETGDDLVVSGAGDSEVRLHRLGRSNGIGAAEPSAVFRCHSKRVKKLAVEDGNPHMIWSASEDGTLRQHDLREGVLCGFPERECRNVLLDLRNATKRSLSDPPRQSLPLKSCAINPMRPHQILVGGSDAFARLYDRRMLPPLSAHQPTPRCVCYYCPAHLSDYTRSALHLTHVAFSPDGRDVLLSYSGEHVYLMDAYNGQDVSTVYRASDVPKRTTLIPLDGAQIAATVLNKSSQRQRISLRDCTRFLNEARKALEENSFLLAIESCSEVLDAGGTRVEPSLRHDCLCVRADALLKRGWKNDMHMAIRDANEARLINPMSPVAHNMLSQALSQLSRHKEALEFATRASYLDPSDERWLEHVTHISSKIAAAEEAKNNRNNEQDNKRDRRSSRIRSLREFFFRSDQDQSDSSDENRRTDREESDIEDDMEMEMEIEMSVAREMEQDTESLGPSSLNLRLRKRSDSARDRRQNIAASSSNGDAGSPSQEELVMDMRQRYVGHCNTGTDIKQASFLGERGEFVASGSDDGRWFIWEKKTGRAVKILSGDENVVNCVQCHPYDCTVATSGIDNTIKLWTPRSKSPRAEEPSAAAEEALRIMSDNQQSMRRQREIGLPIELLQRIRGVEGAPFECTQS